MMKTTSSSQNTGARKKVGQWELQDESPGAFSLPGKVGVGRSSTESTYGEKGITPLPPSPPPNPADELEKAEIREWMEENRIGCINLLLRNYSNGRIREAIEDFERAIDRHKHPMFIPRDRTAYFRSLLR
jgi:hypothetical protein